MQKLHFFAKISGQFFLYKYKDERSLYKQKCILSSNKFERNLKTCYIKQLTFGRGLQLNPIFFCLAAYIVRITDIFVRTKILSDKYFINRKKLQTNILLVRD